MDHNGPMKSNGFHYIQSSHFNKSCFISSVLLILIKSILIKSIVQSYNNYKCFSLAKDVNFMLTTSYDDTDLLFKLDESAFE